MEIFIESVRKYPCLWKSDIPEYKNNELKEAAWREVVKECGLLDVKEAKSTWKKLRDGHRQALARKKTTTGQAAGSVAKWKYEQQMEFLLPTMANRPRQSNVVGPNQEDSIQNNNSQLNSGTPESEDYESPYVFASENKKQSKLVTLMENEIKRREKRCAERDVLRKQILNSTSNNISHHGALEKFFTSMFETTSNLPDRLQIRVQRQIFNVVMEAREEHMTTQVVDSMPGPSTSIPPLARTVYSFRGSSSFRLPSPLPRPNSTLSSYSENENSVESGPQFLLDTQTQNISRLEEQYILPHEHSIQNMSDADNTSMMTQQNVEHTDADDLNIRSFIHDSNFE